MSANLDPSVWVVVNSRYLVPNAKVLVLACGDGRHTKFLIEKGFDVTSVDINQNALNEVAKISNSHVLSADLENGEWPFAKRSFDGIVVTNYLHRPQFELITNTLNDRGLLIYETFMIGNERYGKPSNPTFLLRPNELNEAFAHSMLILRSEQGHIRFPKEANVQRICAVKRARFESETMIVD
jgi:SAM-dependent methyltransferase